MKKQFKLAISLAAVALVATLAPASGAGAQEAGTRVDSLDVATSGSSLTVAGTASFVDVPVLVGNDPRGGALLSGMGADVTKMTVSRPNPAAGNITVSFGVRDFPSGQSASAPQVLYVWPVEVNGVKDNYYLEARRLSIQLPSSPDLTFKLMRDLPGGPVDIATLSGTMAIAYQDPAADPGIVSWDLPLSSIGAAGGDTLGQGTAGGGMGTTYGIPGVENLPANFLGDVAFLEDDYVIPEATVSFGIAPAGTPPALVDTSNDADVSGLVPPGLEGEPSSGDYTGALDISGLAPGDYVVVAKACYGPSNCGMTSANITI